ncbi:MAG TPA: glycosyltransferase 61 family protein [Nitrospira sp.]|nr:glycosyltransferase 61 family protein [Nitrospira sp.]
MPTQSPDRLLAGQTQDTREGVDVLAPVPAKIRTIWASSENADIVTRLRNAPLGQLYRERLKQYTVIRGVARWMWWNLFPLYVRLSVWIKKRYPLVALREYVASHGAQSFTLVGEELVKRSAPLVYPAADADYIGDAPDSYPFPDIFVATITNGTAMGGTNLLLADGQVICHDLLDTQRDSTAEEMHGRALISPSSKQIRLVFRDKNPQSVPRAAVFVDACASNYAHWMTEVLPRVAVFCAEERFCDVPLVINEGLHPNIMESLLQVTGPDRQLIILPVGKSLAIGEMHVTSVAGYVPFERRHKGPSGHSHGLFSSRALALVRERVTASIQGEEAQVWPEKLYLRRNSGVRRLANAGKIERVLADHGYAIVEPDTLTFSQQVQYVSHAKVVVAPTGAGVANTIFCRSGTHVAILISKCKGLAYQYWPNMLTPLGVRLSYVLGEIVDNHAYGVHGDFQVDRSYLMDFLENVEHNISKRNLEGVSALKQPGVQGLVA